MCRQRWTVTLMWTAVPYDTQPEKRKVVHVKMCGSPKLNKHAFMISAAERRAKWLVFLLCFREVPESNLGQETDSPNCSFFYTPSVPPSTCQDSALNKVTNVSFHIPSNSLFSLYPTLDAINSVLLTPLLSKPQIKWSKRGIKWRWVAGP
jgi:hypothetical protein